MTHACRCAFVCVWPVGTTMARTLLSFVFAPLCYVCNATSRLHRDLRFERAV